MSKNILFTYFSAFNPERGGIERISYTLINALKEKGYNVYAIHGEKPNKKEEIDQLPTKSFFLPVSNRKKINCQENKSYYNKIIKDNNINVIINQEGNFSPSYFFLDIEIKDSIKIFSVIHSEPLFNYKSLFTETFRKRNANTPFKRWIRHIILYPFRLKKEKLRLNKRLNYLNTKSNYIVLLSDKFKNELKQFNPHITSDKIISIPNANTYPLSVSSKEYVKQKEVLFVGRLSDNDKRPDRLIQIWSLLGQRHPDWKLRFVGDGNEKDNLIRQASKFGLKNVIFEGYKNPKPYYEESAIICLTSNFEGMPMVILEAKQHGVIPIMFESFASASDIITHEKDGMLIPPFDLNKYTDSLERLMNNENLRHQMSRNSLKSSKCFDLENIVDIWIRYIED